MTDVGQWRDCFLNDEGISKAPFEAWALLWTHSFYSRPPFGAWSPKKKSLYYETEEKRRQCLLLDTSTLTFASSPVS